MNSAAVTAVNSAGTITIMNNKQFNQRAIFKWFNLRTYWP